MAEILKPKSSNGTTRFYTKISQVMRNNLENEFKNEYPKIRRYEEYSKLYSSDNASLIEITDRYISFFPENKEMEEIYRKRIYKHVASKANVYYTSAIDNLDSALTSLLSDNVRSSVSSLYYSTHKFLTSESYKYMYSEFDKETDSSFELDIEHFTSEMYGKYFVNKFLKENNEIDLGEINKENCMDILKTGRGNLNPFSLSYLIFSKKISKNMTNIIKNYIPFLYKIITDEDFSINPTIETKINKLKEIEDRQSNKEEKVTAAIAHALRCYFESENKGMIWGFFALTLRLYWLRQTADYDFDFEVKTSVREISITISTIKDFIKEIKNYNSNTNLKNVLNAPEESTSNEDSKQSSPVLINLYNIETEFNIDNFVDDKIVHITGV